MTPDPTRQSGTHEKKRQAFIEYMDGKTIPLKENKDHVVKKDEIEAVEFGGSASKVNNVPREEDVTLLIKTEESRYAVHGGVQFRTVQETYAFFGFEFASVEEQ